MTDSARCWTCGDKGAETVGDPARLACYRCLEEEDHEAEREELRVREEALVQEWADWESAPESFKRWQEAREAGR